MISCDTNILFPALDRSSARHKAARTFLETYTTREDFCVAEQVLMELYVLLRNPTVCRNPMTAGKAAAVIKTFRSNPHWRIVDVVQDPGIMEWVWNMAANNDLAYRRLFDLRLAATLLHHGVTSFATCNEKDFQDLGFTTVWNPFD